MTKNRFLKYVQKTEHVNWAWFGIPHAAQNKLFPRCNFFARIHKKLEKNNNFLPKSQIFAFSMHLIWPGWFNFLVHNLIVFIWPDFVSVFHMLFVDSRKKKVTKMFTMPKKWKKKFLPTYLSYFLEHVTPSAVPRHIFILLNQY